MSTCFCHSMRASGRVDVDQSGFINQISVIKWFGRGTAIDFDPVDAINRTALRKQTATNAHNSVSSYCRLQLHFQSRGISLKLIETWNKFVIS